MRRGGPSLQVVLAVCITAAVTWPVARLWDSAREPVRLPAFLVVAVLSSAEQTEERHVLRATWWSWRRPDDVHCRFFVAEPSDKVGLAKVRAEQDEFGDLVLLRLPYEHSDDYRSLAEKLVGAFAWISEVYDTAYVLKADVDTYVRLPRVIRELRQQPRKWFAWAYFRGDAQVKRREGKWQEKEWYLCDRYIPYPQGGGYVLSGDIVEYVGRERDSLQRYAAEDVSVGVWMAPLQVERRHDVRFDTEWRSRGCRNDYLVTHKQDASMMRMLFGRDSAGLTLCEAETMAMPAYEYDWSVSPSLCCVR